MKDKKENIGFDWQNMKWVNLWIEDIEEWERLYPGVDVARVVRFDTVQWLSKVKGTQKARKNNWRKFIHNWLRREYVKKSNAA